MLKKWYNCHPFKNNWKPWNNYQMWLCCHAPHGFQTKICWIYHHQNVEKKYKLFVVFCKLNVVSNKQSDYQRAHTVYHFLLIWFFIRMKQIEAAPWNIGRRVSLNPLTPQTDDVFVPYWSLHHDWLDEHIQSYKR